MLVSLARALIEVAGMMLLLRGFIWLFYAKARKDNVVWDLLTAGVMPFMKITRAIMPRFISDFPIPLITFFLLFWIWLGLALLQQAMWPGEAP